MKHLWLAAFPFLLAGCSATSPAFDAAQAGCLAQVAAPAAGTAGTLEVHVVDARGVLLPQAAVQAIGPSDRYQVLCVPGANTETGGDGIARLERLKTGSYRVSAFVTSGNTSLGAHGTAKITPGNATVVTLTVETIK